MLHIFDDTSMDDYTRFKRSLLAELKQTFEFVHLTKVSKPDALRIVGGEYFSSPVTAKHLGTFDGPKGKETIHRGLCVSEIFGTMSISSNVSGGRVYLAAKTEEALAEMIKSLEQAGVIKSRDAREREKIFKRQSSIISIKRRGFKIGVEFIFSGKKYMIVDFNHKGQVMVTRPGFSKAIPFATSSLRCATPVST